MNEKLLSSYAVFKVLSDKEKSIKEVLKNFIATYIIQNNRCNFTLVDFSKRLNKYYGFDLPHSVIKQVLLSFSKTKQSNGNYVVEKSDVSLFAISEINSYKIDIDFVVKKLYDYAEHYLSHILSRNECDNLKNDFIKYFAGSKKDIENSKLISQFILLNTDEKIKDVLENIEIGSLIYKGITEDLVSGEDNENIFWKNDLTIYLDTEVLFDIAGYNGPFYKILAEEFLSIISQINKTKKYIKLRYFKCTKREIDIYFAAAKRVLMTGEAITTDAMRYIIDRCQNMSDVLEQYGLFERLIQENDIILDEDFDCGSFSYKDEDAEDVLDINYTNDYIQYIYNLRNCNNKKAFSDIEFIFVTRKTDTIQKSKDFIFNNRGVPLAVPMEFITSKLWLTLNKGFGCNSDLKTFDIINKSRIIYNGIVNDIKQEKIKEARRKFQEKKYTKEQAISVIAKIRTVCNDSDKFNENTISEIDFIRNSDLSEIQEQIIKDKEDVALSKIEIDNLERKNEDLSSKNSEFKSFIEKQKNDKKCKYIKKIRRNVRIKISICFIICSCSIAGLLYLFVYLIEKKFGINVYNIISLVVSIFFALGVGGIISHTIRRCIEKHIKAKEKVFFKKLEDEYQVLSDVQ